MPKLLRTYFLVGAVCSAMLCILPMQTTAEKTSPKPSKTSAKAGAGLKLQFLSKIEPHHKTPAIVHYRGKVGSVVLEIVDIDLNSPEIYVTIERADTFPVGGSNFEGMAKRVHALAAMNGAYAGSKDYIPIGDIGIKGSMIFKGDRRYGLVITKDNHAFVRRWTGSDRSALLDMETVLGNSPVLVRDGVPDCADDIPFHHDPHVLGSKLRMAVGVTNNNHLLFIAGHNAVTFEEWAEVMQKLGCRDALNLDSGGSRALYFDGTMQTPPPRPLSHILIVKFREGTEGIGSVPTAIPPVKSRPQVRIKPRPKVRPPGTAAVKICAVTHKRANDYCTPTVTGYYTPKQVQKLGVCTKHRAPF